MVPDLCANDLFSLSVRTVRHLLGTCGLQCIIVVLPAARLGSGRS